MAKRRVNMRFVGIGLVILMALAVVAVVLVKVVLRPNPVKVMAQARTEMAVGDWDAAVKNIGKAIRYTRKPDPTLWIALGDASTHMTPKDPQALGQVHYAYKQAIEIDPHNAEALRKLAMFWRDVMEASGMSSQDFDMTREAASKLLEVVPDDPQALYLLSAATIEQWLRGVETDPRKIEEASERLAKVQKLDPADADAPFNLMRVKARRAEEAARAGDKREATRLTDEAEKVIADAAKAQPDNPMMHQRYSVALIRNIMPLKGRLAERVMATPTTKSIAQPLAEDRAARKAAAEPYLHKGVEEAVKAASLVKAGDPHYGEIRIWYCTLLQTPDVDPDAPQEQIIAARKVAQEKAEKAYQDSMQGAPEDQTIRLAYADMLGHMAGRMDDAIKLLSQEQPPNPRWIGARGRMVGDTHILTQQVLTQLKLDRVDQERDAAKRDALIQDADATYQTLLARYAEFRPGVPVDNLPEMLQIKARLQLSRNQLVDATQTLNRALSFYSAGDGRRYETMYQLAKVYLLTQQTGEAKKLLKDVVTFNPIYTPARQMYTELLIREGNIKGNPPSYTDGAVTQIDELEKQLGPTHPAVQQLRLATLDPDKDKARFEAIYKSIPESNLQERAEKSAVAARYNRNDEVIRLLKLIQQERPNDESVVGSLAQAYMKKGDRAGAVAAIDAAMKAQPDNPRLALMKQRLVNPEEARAQLGKMQLDAIEKVPDPLTRELALANYYGQRNDQDKAMEHLVAAQKIAPEDIRVMQGLFALHMDRKEWDKAAYYLEKLAALNSDQANGQVLRVQFALAQGKRDEALDQAKKLTQIRPEFNQSWIMLGSVLQELGRYDDAINAYQQALERKTESAQALKGVIGCYLALNRPGQPSKDLEQNRYQKATDAKLYIETAQRVFPNDPTFREQAQQWELRFGNVEEAIAPREAAIKEHPEDPGVWGDLALTYMNAASTTNMQQAGGATPGSGTPNAAAVAAQQEGNKKKYLTKARDVLAQGAAKFPEIPAFNQNLLLVNLQLKDNDAAEKTALIIASSPEMKGSSNAAMMLSSFYNQVNKPQQAEKALREYLTAHPENVQVEVALANLLKQQNRGDEALKVLEANSNDPAVGRQRIDTLVSLRRIEEAAKELDAAIAVKPTPLLLVQRAQLDISTGNFDQARQRLNQVLSNKPDDLYGLYTRARLNLNDPRGDVNAAIDDLNRVVTLQPKAFEARLQLADAYQRRKLPNEAIRNLEAAARLDLDDKNVRLQLLDLYFAAVPPRWLDAERLLKESRQGSVTLANDIDLTLAEARMWTLRKDPAKALDLIKGVRQQQPDNAAIAQAYLAALLEAKDYRGLLADSDALIKSKPDLWWAYQLRGIAKRLGQGDRPGALAELKTGMAVAIKQNDPNAINSLVHTMAVEVSPDEAKKALAPLAEKDAYWQVVQASIMYDAGDAPGALALTEKVLASPNLPARTQEQALKLAGIMYLAQTPPNVPKAVGIYRELLKMYPNDVAAMNNLASLLVEEKTPTYSPSESLMYSQKVYEMSIKQGVDKADMAYIMDTHAWALIMNGRLDEGISLLRSAMEKKSFVDGHYHLGRAYMLKQPPDLLEAQRALDQAWQMIQDQERDGRFPNPILKARVEEARNELKQKPR
jgi:tetratricopeptide (TPR) repeat protein